MPSGAASPGSGGTRAARPLAGPSLASSRSMLLFAAAHAQFHCVDGGGFFQADDHTETDDPLGLVLLALNVCAIIGYIAWQRRAQRKQAGAVQSPEEQRADEHTNFRFSYTEKWQFLSRTSRAGCRPPRPTTALRRGPG